MCNLKYFKTNVLKVLIKNVHLKLVDASNA